MAKQWTDQLVEDMQVYVKNGYTDEEIAEALGFRDPRTVAFKRWEIGLYRRAKHGNWTEERLAVLTNPANVNKSNVVLAKLLHIDPSTVHHKRRELGLPTSTLRYWTPEEVAFLKEHYPTKGTAYICRHLNRDAKAVQAKVHALQIRRKRRPGTRSCLNPAKTPSAATSVGTGPYPTA